MASILRSPTRPERVSLWGGVLSTVVLLGWGYLAAMAWGMEHMEVSGRWLLMPRMVDWHAGDLALVFVMWAIMMAAMMLPSVMPVFAVLRRIDRSTDTAYAWQRSTSFALGYLAVWSGFAAVATVLQWGLLEVRLVTPMMDSASVYLSAALLILAGLYQFSPLKHACLQRCRSPLSFLLNHGDEGGFRLGLRMGIYCTGCCAMLMLLLFVLGVMNLWWILALTVLVILEKWLVGWAWFARTVGMGLLVWGCALLMLGAMA